MTEKKKLRSPNYPYLDLEEALARTQLIWEKDKRASTTMGAILEHMGYSTSGKGGKSGSGGRAISALRQYGLIEELDGKYRVSEAGFRLIHLPDDSPEKLQLLKQAALKPAMFRKVLEEFKYDLPSLTTMTSHLILSEGFNPDSVNAFVRTLWKTKEFANLGTGEYNLYNDDVNAIDAEFVSVAEPMPETQLQRQLHSGQGRTSLDPNVAYGTINVGIDGPDHVFSYQLSFPRNIRAEVRIFGKDLRKQDIERLMKEVGDLAGAFDEEPETTQKPTEAEATQ